MYRSVRIRPQIILSNFAEGSWCLGSPAILWSENLILVSQGPTQFYKVKKFNSISQFAFS